MQIVSRTPYPISRKRGSSADLCSGLTRSAEVGAAFVEDEVVGSADVAGTNIGS